MIGVPFPTAAGLHGNGDYAGQFHDRLRPCLRPVEQRYPENNLGAQIGGTSYDYDPHGRQQTATDARNGTTTYGYNSMDQVTTVIPLFRDNGVTHKR